MKKAKGKSGNRRMRRVSGFAVRQVQHFEALVQIALHALMRMSDPEAVHDLRISLRSQRVLLGLFSCRSRIKDLRNQLATAATQIDLVRDLEIALARAESYRQETEAGQVVVEAWRNELAVQQADLLSHLHVAHLDDILEDAESAWSATILPKSRQALQARARKRVRKLGKLLIRQAEAVDQDPSLERWNQTRLTVERLLYSVEELSELLTRRQRRRLKPLRCLQQALSARHDLEWFEARFSYGTPMPEEWVSPLSLEQHKARHDASTMLAALRLQW